MKKNKLNNKVQIFFIIILLVVSLVASFKVGSFFFDTLKNKKDNNKLIEDVIKEIPSNDNNSETKLVIDFVKLLEKNKDTKGWIKYNNDKINYPIVQAKDNAYYLDKNFYKKYNQAGSIFIDYRNNSFDDKNVVLYGHSMLDNSMFGSLKDLFTKDFFDNKENNIIELRDLNDNVLKYQIFSYYIIEKEEYYITTSFKSDKEFLNFLNNIKRRSIKNFNINLNNDDKIITLSTCSGVEGTTKRKVVHAKKVIE
jgi:sortase B